MPHDVTLIATFAVGFVLAFVFGFIANRLRLPPLVGYIVAGVAIGVFTPGMVADSAIAGQLADIGIILLMFGVGLHFSLDDLLAVRRIVIPGAIMQIAITGTIGTLLARAGGFSLGGAVVMGLCLSVASTVVLLKSLEQRNAVATTNGRVTIGWLIVEDLVMVMVLVILPAVAGILGGKSGAGGGGSAVDLVLALAVTVAKVLAFGGIVLFVGPRVMPWLLRQVARTGSRELFTLAVLALSVGIAFGSAELFGVSFALGAFFAGVVLNESDLSHKAATNVLPLQDAFAVLFFISVGMLFDPSIFAAKPQLLAALLLVILVGKALAALAIVLVLGYPLRTALFVSASLAQIGEFSFILAGLGISLGLLESTGLSLILAGALLSITLNKLMFAGYDAVTAWLGAGAGGKRPFERIETPALQELETGLVEAQLRAAAKAAAHKTLSPEELNTSFPIFEQLRPEQAEVVILHFLPHNAEPGQQIIRRGDAADAAYFISQGEVEVAVAGRRIHLKAGDFFGEMALISGQPRSADVTALDYCKLLKLTTADFREILRRYPEIRNHVTQMAAQRDEMNRASAAGGDAGSA